MLLVLQLQREAADLRSLEGVHRTVTPGDHLTCSSPFLFFSGLMCL